MSLPASRRARRRLASLLVAGVAALAAAPAAQAAFPGGNGLIAMSGSFTFCDGSQIAVMEPNGDDWRALTPVSCETEDGPSYHAPDWAADGSRLLASDRANVPTFIGLDGIATPLDVAPYSVPPALSLSPDGTRYAYARVRQTARGPRTEVWVARVAGGPSLRLGRGRLARFSPDGRTLAVVVPAMRNGRECLTGGTPCKGGGIYLVNARTGQRIRRVGPVAGSLDWAPRGDRLVYSTPSAYVSQDTDLYLARADGKGVRRLTRTKRRAEGGAVFSPDGRRIAFVARTFPRETSVRRAVFTMRSRGGDARRIWAGGPENTEDGGSIAISWQPLPR